MWWEYAKYVVIFATGSGFTYAAGLYRGRVQRMKCFHIEEEILSKIPIKNEDGSTDPNIYVKTFRLKNTTNKDIESFKVFFQFDALSIIKESTNRSKTGFGKYKMKQGNNGNECHFFINKFNRGDEVVFTFRIANITDNKFYIREDNCIGFKIVCKNGLNAQKRSESRQSNVLLTKQG